MSIRLITFGGLRGSVDDIDLDWLSVRRLNAALLVYLTVERRATRSRLHALFWPETPEPSAARRLNQALYLLRRALGHAAIQTHGIHVIASEGLGCDALDFENALDNARLELAADLYAGPFLDGVHLVSGSRQFEEWVAERRARYRRMLRNSCRLLLQDLVHRDPRSAVRIAGRWSDAEPLEDEAQHWCIDVLWQTGDARAALARFDEYVERLKAEELQPLDETLELVRRIRTDAAHAATAPALSHRSSDPPLRAHHSGWLRRYRMRLALAAAVVLLLAIRGNERLEPEDARHGIGDPDTLTLAVLPFVNLSGDPADEYFTDGISDELQITLARLPGLRVVSRTSAFSFKGRSTNIKQIAESLGVRYVVEGSFRSQGDRVRIGAQLVDAANGYQTWSDVYDLKRNEVVNVQEMVARAIVESLRIALRPGVGDVRLGTGTDNAAAYDAYLRGRAALTVLVPDSLHRAGKEFEAAIALDPSFARAHSGLAAAMNYLHARMGLQMQLDSAGAAARRALELDRTLGEAHAVLALRGMKSLDWESAERSFSEAIRHEPASAAIRSLRSLYLLTVGRDSDALADAGYATVLDPLAMLSHSHLARHHIAVGRFQEGIVAAERAVSLDPLAWQPHHNLAWAYVMLGRYDTAATHMRRALELGREPLDGMDDVLLAVAAAGRTDVTAMQIRRRGLDRLRTWEDRTWEDTQGQFRAPGELAIWLCLLKETSAMYRVLEAAVDRGALHPAALARYPLRLEAFLEPRFQRLRASMRLPALPATDTHSDSVSKPCH